MRTLARCHALELLALATAACTPPVVPPSPDASDAAPPAIDAAPAPPAPVGDPDALAACSRARALACAIGASPACAQQLATGIAQNHYSRAAVQCAAAAASVGAYESCPGFATACGGTP